MKTINRIKALLAPMLSALTDTVYNGSIGYFGRKLYCGSSGVWKELAYIDDIIDNLNKQSIITTNIILTEGYTNNHLWIDANCTITIPNDINLPLEIVGYVGVGFTLTFATATGVTLVGNASVITVGADKTFTLTKKGATNVYLLKIGG